MLNNILKEVRKIALEEINKYGSPDADLFYISESMAEKLAKQMNVDANIVLIGHALMDIKLGKAIAENKINNHVQMSVNESEKILNTFNLDEKNKNKIINCVEAHHGDVPFLYKEAEICANADCYRFLHPRGILIYLNVLMTRKKNINDCLKQMEFKMDEKMKILTIDICKQELEPYYKEFKKMIKASKNFPN